MHQIFVISKDVVEGAERLFVFGLCLELFIQNVIAEM